MRRNRTVSERLTAAALCLLMLVSLLPSGSFVVRAEDTVNDDTYGPCGTVSVSDGTLTVDDTDQTYITVTNSNVMTLQYVEDDGTRGSDGWWVGMKVNAPSDMTEEQLQSAKYTSTDGTERSFWNNKNSQSGDAVHYIWLYGLVTQALIENDDDGKLNYVWTFDWDNDSTTASQTVKLTVDTTNLILMDGENRVYPSVYATLSSTYGGTVEVDNDGNATLTVSEAQVALDTQTMKWYIDVTVTLPDGATDAMEGNNAFTSPTTYHLELEPDGDSYTVSGSRSGEFSWKIGSQVVEQVLSIVAEDITLLKADQAALTFEKTENPVEKKVKAMNYTNKATGGSVDGEITYASSNTDVATVDKNGKVTFKAAGETVITATKAGNKYYNDVTASYTLVLVNEDWELNWQTSDPEALSFREGLTYENKASYSTGNGMTSEGITYASDREDIATVDANGVVTVKSVGEVIISAKKIGAFGMNEKTIYYTLTINKGDQAITIDGEDTITFADEQTFSYSISGICGTGETTVASSNADVATVELQQINGQLTAVVTPKSAGAFTLTVSNPGDNNYNPADATKEITVLYAETDAKFEKGNEITVTYNDDGNRYTNKLTVSGKGAITYSSSDEEIAAVDSEGEVTIKKAGTVVITASKAADDEYGAVELSYTLTVNRADQRIKLNPASDSVSNGVGSYTIGITEEEGWVSSETYSFTINEKDETLLGTTVDEDGKITIAAGAYGTMTVKVTRDADQCFKKWTGIFTLTVTQLDVDNDKFALSGTYNATTGWYNSKVTVTYENGLLTEHNGEFAESWVLGDGIYTADQNAVVLCVQDGAIAHDINVNKILGGIYIDTKAPTDLTIEYSDDVAGQVLEALTFGYYKAKMTVTISAADATSGVATVYYKLAGDAEYTAAQAKDGKVTFSIHPQYKGNVQFYVVDAAGNASEVYNGKVTTVVDSISPVIAVEWNGEANSVVGTTRYYDGDAVATITITESNFHADDVTIQGGAFDEAWSEVEENTWVNTVTLSEEGEHVLTITYKDRSTNPLTGENTKNGKYTSETIVIDNTNPEVSVSIDTQGKRQYFNTEQVVTVTVVEENFASDRVEISTGSDVGVSMGQWKHDGDTHTLELTFSGDARYTLKVAVADLADHEASTTAQYFTVDRTAPSVPEVTYSTSFADKILEAITFHYYQAPVTVTITATDATAGVQSFTYAYVLNGNVSGVNQSGEGTLKATQNGDTYTASFTIPAASLNSQNQFNGYVEVTACDMAGNTRTTKDKDDVLIVDNIAPVCSVEWNAATNEVNGIRYYDSKAVATITITEANFYAGSEVVVTGGKLDGAWTSVGVDTWQNTVTLNDEGDHVLGITYTDRSGNVMESYISGTIIVDHTNPVITASISNGANRQYYNETQTVTVTVVEKNFDSSLVNLSAGADTGVTYGQWQHDGDTHTITITFAGDANYALNADVADLANRTAALTEQQITVDKTAPTVNIEYSVRVADRILSGITFYYYKAPVTVTITATDPTAGLTGFDYAYTLAQGVSTVNKGGTGSVEARWDTAKNAYVASFQVPAQFNGNITVTATDRSGNTTTESNGIGAVVDTINPTVTVTYNDPYQVLDDVSYYAGNIEAAITISEANFDASDVVVTVMKDGKAYDVDVNWVNNSVDSHTGRLTLTEDGDYTLSVSYKDISGNEMETYVSKLMTLDAQSPVIRVSDIVANSANKADPYGFVITITDTNLDVESLQPVLQAVMQNSDGLYVTQTIDLGEPVEVTAGQEYTYTVENLDQDALYTLTCEAQDLAGNRTNTMVLDDGQSYAEVLFSINRSGSTFGFGDKYTEELIGQYYVYEVYEDIVIIEVNVDPIEDYVVMLNGVQLEEGVDYTTEQTSEPDSWSKRTYIIHKELFAEEGEYSIIVNSKDKAETNAYSDVKNLFVAYVVDQTAPILTISGLEEGGRYQTNEQSVTIIPTDEGGCLNSLTVLALDANGDPLTDESGNDISVRFDMSGEEFLTYLEENNGMVTFTVPSGLNIQVQIICTDCALKDDGTTNEYNETFSKVTVSSNQLVIFYANTPLFIGTIVGGLALIFFIILLLKRKKNQK